MSERDDQAWALPRKRDRHGLRTQRRHSPSLLHDIAERLQRIAGERETTTNRQYIEDVLAPPYWGLRILAIRALGRWGGRVNKAWLQERAQRPTAHGRVSDRAQRWQDLETLTARDVLRPLLKEHDGQWLLDAFFADGGHMFYPLVTGPGIITDDMLSSRLPIEMNSDQPQNRLGVLRMIAMRRDCSDGHEMVSILAMDEDADVRGFAEVLLRQYAATDADRQADTPAIVGKQGQKHNERRPVTRQFGGRR